MGTIETKKLANSKLGQCHWSQATILDSGDKYISAVLAAIDAAAEEIWLEFYIFDHSETAEMLLSAIKNAHQKRGVAVRLLVDGIGSYWQINQLLNFARTTGIEVRVFHRVRWFSMWRHLIRLNKRNHRKVILIDGRQAFIGSINIYRSHFAKEVGEALAWRDLAVSVEGPPLRELREEMDRTWRKKITLRAQKSKILHVNRSWKSRFLHWRELLHRIHHARQNIRIINAYFIPHRSLLSALTRAAREGAGVTLVLPGKTDIRMLEWAKPALYQRLLKDGVKIFEYQPRVLHTKLAMIDDWWVVGSHNLNYRSLIHDLEIEVVLDKTLVGDSLEKYWQDTLAASKKIEASSLLLLKPWSWILCRIALWIRFFL